MKREATPEKGSGTVAAIAKAGALSSGKTIRPGSNERSMNGVRRRSTDREQGERLCKFLQIADSLCLNSENSTFAVTKGH